MNEIQVTFGNRVVKWEDVHDDVTAILLQSLVQALGPAEEVK